MTAEALRTAAGPSDGGSCAFAMLSDDELRLVLQLLDAGSISALERADRRSWLISSESLDRHWTAQVREVFGVLSLDEASTLVGHQADGQRKLSTHREAYGALFAWAGRYAPNHRPEASLIGRAIRAVRMIRDNLPLRAVVATMNLAWEGRGASEADLNDLEKSLEMDERERSSRPIRLPEALRAVLRVCNGQTLPIAPHTATDDLGYGCMGGYCVYSTFINTRLLSCEQIAHFSGPVRTALVRMADMDPADAHQHVMVASSFALRRPFLVHVPSGRLSVCISHPVSAVPPSANADGDTDATLRWFEEFGRRLRDKFFGPDPCVGALDPLPHFQVLPRCLTSRQYSDVVTRSLRVTFSASLTDTSNSTGVCVYDWSYSVQFSLLSEAEQAELHPNDRLTVVQLKSRHWRIGQDDGSVESIDGPAVIGEYPILRRPNSDGTGDTKPFVYQSRTRCTYAGPHVPSMRGYFRFVCGTIEHPVGDEFNAECGEVFFDREPGFIF